MSSVQNPWHSYCAQLVQVQFLKLDQHPLSIMNSLISFVPVAAILDIFAQTRHFLSAFL